MREIIVRAWEYKKKEWHYFHIPQDIGKIVVGMSNTLNYENWTEYVDSEDKRNRKIYDGDFLLREEQDGIEIGEIIWHNFCWCVHFYDEIIPLVDYSPKTGEIIGNRYENPELLERINK